MTYNNFKTYSAPVVLNIPKKLIQEHKRDKDYLELIALSICIKTKYGSSVIKNASIRKIMQLLHCGQSKAKTLLNACKNNSELFVYNEDNNSLTAIRMHNYVELTTDKHNRKIYQEYNIKFEIKDYSLRELIKKFRGCLFLSAINAKERIDKFESDGNRTILCNSHSVLTGKKFSNICGTSRTSFLRLAKDLQSKKIITKHDSSIRLASQSINKEGIKEFKSHNPNSFLVYDLKRNLAYSVSPTSYSINNLSTNRKFTNIIFNYSKRQTSFSYKKLSKIDEYLSRMDH